MPVNEVRRRLGDDRAALGLYSVSRMVFGPLSNGQIDESIERGWTLLRRAFPPAVAQAVRRDLGKQIGVDLDRPEQWTQPQVWLQKMITESTYTDALTDRFHSAVDQLVGPGRWEMTQEMGWWPISFPGFDDPPTAIAGTSREDGSTATSRRAKRRCSTCSASRPWTPAGAEPSSSRARTT